MQLEDEEVEKEQEMKDTLGYQIERAAATAAAIRLGRFIIHAIPVHKKDIWKQAGKNAKCREIKREREGDR